MDAQKTIVVGIDGSACARDALRFAVQEARLRGDQLRVVWTTWQMPINIYAAGGLMPVLDDGTAERLAHRELDEVLGDDPGVVVELLVEEGGAARVLIRESEKAELLVVGSRGARGLRRPTAWFRRTTMCRSRPLPGLDRPSGHRAASEA